MPKRKFSNFTDNSKTRNVPFRGIRILIALLLIVIIVTIIGAFIFLRVFRADLLVAAPQQYVAMSLADLQATTLTITTISTTMVCAIVSILIFYRELKIEKSNIKIEKSIHELSMLRDNTDALMELFYLQSLQSQYLYERPYERIIEIGESILSNEISPDTYSYHCLYAINGYLEKQIGDGQYTTDDKVSVVDLIIKFAKKIAEEPSLSETQKSLAYIQLSNSYFKRFRTLYLLKHTAESLTDLDHAIKYLKLIDDKAMSKSIVTLATLIYYWRFMVYNHRYIYTSIPTLQRENLKEQLYCLKEAESYLREESESDGIYANLRGCIQFGYAKYYDTIDEGANADTSLGNAEKIFKDLYVQDNEYWAALINQVDIIIYKIECCLNITHPCLLSQTMLNITDAMIQEISTHIDNAKKIFDIIKNKNINYYYKLADVLTYEYIVKTKKRDCEDQKSCIAELNKIATAIENNLDSANNLEANTLMVLCRRRSFFELIGEKQKADDVNHFIKKVDQENGQYWERLTEEI